MLALITASFAEGRERTRALGLYTAVAMGGASLGLVLGGIITEWVSWRWVLFVNVPIGVAVLLLAPRFLSESPRLPGRFDIAGALTSTGGMAVLVYAFIRVAASGWHDALALASFGAAAVLLGLFLVTETRARQPITPLRLFAHRGRSGSYLARLLLVAGMFGMFFFLTQFVQDILGFSPLRAGLAFVPMTAMLFAVSRAAPRLLARFPAKALMVAGLLPVVAGMAWLARITPAAGYLSGVLGPMLLLGGGMGVVFVPLTMASLAGVRPEDSGAASSMVNVTQQVGGSLGLAILVTVYGSATGGAAAAGPGLARARDAITHGMASAFGAATIFDICALLVIIVAIGSWRRSSPAGPAPRCRLPRCRPPRWQLAATAAQCAEHGAAGRCYSVTAGPAVPVTAGPAASRSQAPHRPRPGSQAPAPPSPPRAARRRTAVTARPAPQPGAATAAPVPAARHRHRRPRPALHPTRHMGPVRCDAAIVVNIRPAITG